ncbi:MAG: energy-coupled thiamine transporter ThiT [Bacillota bacterium]|nr:energy-coupled thiamine transporter ThiT [Bacillota bacterium]
MNKNTRFIVEAGIMLALGFVLSQFKLFEMPLGGSVTAGSMIPLLFIAYRWGIVRGVLVGIIHGLLQMQFGGYVIGFVQGMLDYPLAFGAVGLAGLASTKLMEKFNVKSVVIAIIGAIIGFSVRYSCHLVSGAIFFEEYAGDKNPWIHSLEYNAFLIPELIIAIVILTLIWVPVTNRLPQYSNKKNS